MVPNAKVSGRWGEYHRSRPAARTAGRHAGFTLVELLVVIAIIALLLSILLPSLASARGAAKAAACGAQLHGCGNGLAAYTTEFNEWLPGYNTSGVAIRALQYKLTAEPWRIHKPKVPVQPFDWITPFLNLEGNLPDKRVERFRIATQHYKCPSQASVNSVLYWDGAPPPDVADFRAYSDWDALSYLMPVAFQYWGTRQDDMNIVLSQSLGMPSRPVTAEAAPPYYEVRAVDYLSRIGRVGPPAKKIAAADGTRYLRADGILDHDIGALPQSFGSFTVAGGWWQGCVAYGVGMPGTNWDDQPIARASLSNGKNLSLTYRHGKPSSGNGRCQGNKGTINALFFDGHVTRLSDYDSRRIDLWYPTGAPVLSAAEGMHMVEDDYVIH